VAPVDRHWDVQHFTAVIRKVLRVAHETRAAVAGTRFYCQALAGESDYKVSVNSDMTVSCNCQDYDGSGQLGDLRSMTLAQVFAGPVARRFRASRKQRPLVPV
jgi:hypothetical protein